MKAYVIRAGDYLSRLAYELGFDADTVKDPKNEDLSKLRHPDVLQPGDVLYLPEAPPPNTGLAGGTENSYAAEVPTISVELKLLDHDGQPIANEDYEIDGLGDPVTGKTADDGGIKFSATVVTREIDVRLPNKQIVLSVGVGDMDPITEVSGYRKRLLNLGFAAPDDEDDADALNAAIADFQSAQGTDPNGQVDDATRAAIESKHTS